MMPVIGSCIGYTKGIAGTFIEKEIAHYEKLGYELIKIVDDGHNVVYRIVYVPKGE